MATATKRLKNVYNKPSVKNVNDYDIHPLSTLSDDHDFIARNEICPGALGLLYWITKKFINNRSFSSLCHEKGLKGFKDVLINERNDLSVNINSVQKCLVINRLIAEHPQNSDQIDKLYEELKTRMSNAVPSLWTEDHLYMQVLDWQELQARRRLQYVKYSDKSQSLLTLQRAATKFCMDLIDRSRIDFDFWQREGRIRLAKLLYHSFIIIVQPTGLYGNAATQYKKLNNTHSAQINSRIICLLDSHLIGKYIQLSDIDVKVCPFNSELTADGDIQPSLQWKTRTIISSNGERSSFLYAELDSIMLNKLDAHGKYPLYNSTLCQLDFRTKLSVIEPSLQIDLAITSQPFGICSHGYFFPEFTAEILLMEMAPDTLNKKTPQEQQILLADIVRSYYTLISGVEPNQFTYTIFINVFKEAYEKNSDILSGTLFTIYQESLAKLIAQIKCLSDYPFLSLMYYDGLFRGICDYESDRKIQGEKDRSELFLRFNSLMKQKSGDNAVVRYIVHNGRLSRATFEMKIFPYDICRLIFESASQRALHTRIYSTISNRTFRDFQLYFSHDLYRISEIAPPDPTQYNPLIPILWEMTRNRDDRNSTNGPILCSSGTDFLVPYDQMDTNEAVTVTAKIDPTNPGQVTLSIGFKDQIVRYNDELIQLISKKLRELCHINENGSSDNN